MLLRSLRMAGWSPYLPDCGYRGQEDGQRWVGGTDILNKHVIQGDKAQWVSMASGGTAWLLARAWTEKNDNYKQKGCRAQEAGGKAHFVSKDNSFRRSAKKKKKRHYKGQEKVIQEMKRTSNSQTCEQHLTQKQLKTFPRESLSSLWDWQGLERWTTIRVGECGHRNNSWGWTSLVTSRTALNGQSWYAVWLLRVH